MSKSPSDALVILGATGDLTFKMIFPALQAMGHAKSLLPSDPSPGSCSV